MYKVKYIFALIVLLFLCGCASDEYYRDEAAASAREFLLNDLKHISPENKAYVNYTYPEILQAPILPDSEFSQLCFAWHLPSPKITLLVYGSSKNNFRTWFPIRVVFKKYSKEESLTMEKVDLDKLKLKGESNDSIIFRGN